VSAAGRQIFVAVVFPAVLVGAVYVMVFHRAHMVDERAAEEGVTAAERALPPVGEHAAALRQDAALDEQGAALQAKQQTLVAPPATIGAERATAGWLARLLEAHNLTLESQSAKVVKPAAPPPTDDGGAAARAAAPKGWQPTQLVTVEFQGGYLDVVNLLDAMRDAPQRAVPTRLKMRRAEHGGDAHGWTLTVAL
jgi:hypothetical protein